MLGGIVQTLSVLLAGKFVISEGQPNVLLLVHGITNQSVDLVLPVNHAASIQEIFWNFQSYILVHFTNNHLEIKNSEFNNRLETLDNGATLRINDLRKEDAGIYSVTIDYTDKKKDKISYELIVYEPVPFPAIRSEVTDDNPEQCNVTLHCAVPSNTSDFLYTCKCTLRDSEYQDIKSNASFIWISLPLDHQDVEVACIVRNPADQKNISFNVPSICFNNLYFHQSKGERRQYYLFYLAILPVLGMVLGYFLLLKRNNKKRKESKEMEEIHYTDLAPRSYINQRIEHKDEDCGAVIYSAVVHSPT
ncbi:uncharacterized protein LOC120981663 [Bufo bufo]|uniref:uncharacterized protein LOC120981663 n=1 Tax=Bufo bufo TaxID=8384 RepID=UPI001ABEE6BB|nr:uncharacterized protein LOC120981663 [Bufo bufo]